MNAKFEPELWEEYTLFVGLNGFGGRGYYGQERFRVKYDNHICYFSKNENDIYYAILFLILYNTLIANV